MPTRQSKAVWKGSLKEGQGTMQAGGGAPERPYSFGSRFEQEEGSNPEELIGAAHAGCFSMALAGMLAEAGHPPEEIDTTAEVSVNPAGAGFEIGTVRLATQARVPGIDEATFQAKAAEAKANCPVSKALAGVTIELEARLVS